MRFGPSDRHPPPRLVSPHPQASRLRLVLGQRSPVGRYPARRTPSAPPNANTRMIPETPDSARRFSRDRLQRRLHTPDSECECRDEALAELALRGCVPWRYYNRAPRQHPAPGGLRSREGRTLPAVVREAPPRARSRCAALPPSGSPSSDRPGGLPGEVEPPSR